MTTPSPGASAGQRLGPYELLLPIAHGGMGTVWAAREICPASAWRIVAVKTMLPGMSSDPRFVRMFLSESRIASRIHHPNVCAILGQGEQDGILYYAMEWVDGDALVALLGGASTRPQCEAVPCAVAVKIAIEAARGLHAAHELRDEGGELIGVVHRDVSPHNILLTRNGTVKIADFGVAKAVALNDNPTTSTGHIKGKIHFMAPEQVYGDALDRRTDVFTLGIVLYQLSTGTHPFAGGHDLAVMSRVVSPAAVTPPRALCPGYPPDLEAVVMKAMAKRPEDRFASMREFAAALEAVEARLAVPREEVVAYIRGALAERVAQRAALIAQARRAVEARDGAPDAGAPDGGVTRTSPRRGPALATGAALLVVGALLGAASLLWVRGGIPPAPSGAGAVGANTAAPSAGDAAPGGPSAPAAEASSDEPPVMAYDGTAPPPYGGTGAAPSATPADAGAPNAVPTRGRPGGWRAPHEAGMEPDDAGAEPDDAGVQGKAKFRDPGF